ncbi:MAG TPA: hypothetical protein VM532_09025 [Burkholderiales bacterium]|nr:hypothetical protein [Burkholderiales bacterium]
MANMNDGSEITSEGATEAPEPWREDLERLRQAFRDFLQPSANMKRAKDQLSSLSALYHGLAIDRELLVRPTNDALKTTSALDSHATAAQGALNIKNAPDNVQQVLRKSIKLEEAGKIILKKSDLHSVLQKRATRLLQETGADPENDPLLNEFHKANRNIQEFLEQERRERGRKAAEGLARASRESAASENVTTTHVEEKGEVEKSYERYEEEGVELQEMSKPLQVIVNWLLKNEEDRREIERIQYERVGMRSLTNREIVERIRSLPLDVTRATIRVEEQYTSAFSPDTLHAFDAAERMEIKERRKQLSRMNNAQGRIMRALNLDGVERKSQYRALYEAVSGVVRWLSPDHPLNSEFGSFLAKNTYRELPQADAPRLEAAKSALHEEFDRVDVFLQEPLHQSRILQFQEEMQAFENERAGPLPSVASIYETYRETEKQYKQGYQVCRNADGIPIEDSRSPDGTEHKGLMSKAGEALAAELDRRIQEERNLKVLSESDVSWRTHWGETHSRKTAKMRGKVSAAHRRQIGPQLSQQRKLELQKEEEDKARKKAEILFTSANPEGKTKEDFIHGYIGKNAKAIEDSVNRRMVSIEERKKLQEAMERKLMESPYFLAEVNMTVHLEAERELKNAARWKSPGIDFPMFHKGYTEISVKSVNLAKTIVTASLQKILSSMEQFKVQIGSLEKLDQSREGVSSNENFPTMSKLDKEQTEVQALKDNLDWDAGDMTARLKLAKLVGRHENIRAEWEKAIEDRMQKERSAIRSGAESLLDSLTRQSSLLAAVIFPTKNQKALSDRISALRDSSVALLQSSNEVSAEALEKTCAELIRCSNALPDVQRSVQQVVIEDLLERLNRSMKRAPVLDQGLQDDAEKLKVLLSDQSESLKEEGRSKKSSSTRESSEQSAPIESGSGIVQTATPVPAGSDREEAGSQAEKLPEVLIREREEAGVAPRMAEIELAAHQTLLEAQLVEADSEKFQLLREAGEGVIECKNFWDLHKEITAALGEVRRLKDGRQDDTFITAANEWLRKQSPRSAVNRRLMEINRLHAEQEVLRRQLFLASEAMRKTLSRESPDAPLFKEMQTHVTRIEEQITALRELPTQAMKAIAWRGDNPQEEARSQWNADKCWSVDGVLTTYYALEMRRRYANEVEGQLSTVRTMTQTLEKHLVASLTENERSLHSNVEGLRSALEQYSAHLKKTVTTPAENAAEDIQVFEEALNIYRHTFMPMDLRDLAKQAQKQSLTFQRLNEDAQKQLAFVRDAIKSDQTKIDDMHIQWQDLPRLADAESRHQAKQKLLNEYDYQGPQIRAGLEDRQSQLTLLVMADQAAIGRPQILQDASRNLQWEEKVKANLREVEDQIKAFDALPEEIRPLAPREQRRQLQELQQSLRALRPQAQSNQWQSPALELCSAVEEAQKQVQDRRELLDELIGGAPSPLPAEGRIDVLLLSNETERVILKRVGSDKAREGSAEIYVVTQRELHERAGLTSAQCANKLGQTLTINLRSQSHEASRAGSPALGRSSSLKKNSR